MKITWMIGGAQGTGVDTSANIFGNAIARAGYYIYGNREYYSNIKGRHSYFNLTISDEKARSISHKVDILASFDAETVFQHYQDVQKVIIYNKGVLNVEKDRIQSIEPETAERIPFKTVKDVIDYLESKGVTTIGIDYDEILKKVAEEIELPLSVIDRARNTIAISASYDLLGLRKDYLYEALKRTFKQETFVKLNLSAADKVKLSPIFDLKELPQKKRRVQIDGNTAVAIGKIYAGIGFQSYYPITPASDESTFIEAHQEVLYVDPVTGDKRKRTIVVVQAEDELAAVNMASGAALTGVRAATATSGPGFSLMTEGIGWAGMNEVPIVITYYMRSGPSTGQPTRTSQADLLFAMHVSHGEFPRIVIASGDHVEALKDAIWAFNLAEKYQTPVIHLVEKALANAYSIVDLDELGGDIEIERSTIGDDNERFKFTDSGISPRLLLGESTVYYTGDEHNTFGHISEDPVNRVKMYEKRMRKLETADKEIPEEKRYNVYGDLDSKYAIVTWGSPKGAILDAVEELDQKFAVIQLRMFNPFPKSVKKLLEDKDLIIDIEGNYEAQAAILLKQYGVEVTNYILKWNGRPMGRDEVRDGILSAIKGEKRVVLNAGS
ncbi:2-oxoacid:ferredoxin oxidoreductase subunit alpha [Acidianus sp.]|uniref:2-oxoacid:ferredoxin oxidoreductase subunit alpha n=1 Tax=Acidianus sp. TaxID=1872104 RepID=UPI00397B0C09